MGKILIKSTKESNLLDTLIYYMINEKLDYEIVNNLDVIDENITNIIFIDDNDDITNIDTVDNIPIILISNRKKIIKKDNLVINYIVTNLINDNAKYTEVQKEYLLKKGIYNVLITKINELIVNDNNYNGLVYDLTEMKSKPNDWIFSFESIADTYAWLSRMNRNTSNNFIQKIISFYSDLIFNDSVKEINYLSDKILNLKNKKKAIDIFIYTKKELQIMKNNFFFKLLLKNTSSNYSIYFVDKDEILKNDYEIVNKLKDGVAIYENCVYKDTYDNEFSLGIVNCNIETVKEYNEYFDYILDKYGKKLNMDGDIDEL